MDEWNVDRTRIAAQVQAWEAMRDAGRTELANRLQKWLDAKGKEWSPRRLSIDADLADNAVGRILERPTRETDTETWVKLALYLHWDPREVLLLAGGIDPEVSPDPEVWLETALRLLPLTATWREHLRRQAKGLAELSLLETSGVASVARPESPPTKGRKARSNRQYSRAADASR